MARIYMFSDEAGDFTFRDTPGASNYFLIATATMTDCSIGDELQQLQRELTWGGIHIEAFHAVNDKPAIRQRVYELIAASDVRIDVTALEKRRTRPDIAADPVYFYKLANYLHFKYVVPKVATSSDDLMVVASSLQVKKKRQALHDAVRDVVGQVSPAKRFVTAFLENKTDPCLQLADYGAWAVQRWLERGDKVWLDLVAANVRSVFQPFQVGRKLYY